MNIVEMIKKTNEDRGKVFVNDRGEIYKRVMGHLEYSRSLTDGVWRTSKYNNSFELLDCKDEFRELKFCKIEVGKKLTYIGECNSYPYANGEYYRQGRKYEISKIGIEFVDEELCTYINFVGDCGVSFTAEEVENLFTEREVC